MRERKTAREECECVNTFQREVKKSKRERERERDRERDNNKKGHSILKPKGCRLQKNIKVFFSENHNFKRRLKPDEQIKNNKFCFLKINFNAFVYCLP